MAWPELARAGLRVAAQVAPNAVPHPYPPRLNVNISRQHTFFVRLESIVNV